MSTPKEDLSLASSIGTVAIVVIVLGVVGIVAYKFFSKKQIPRKHKPSRKTDSGEEVKGSISRRLRKIQE